VPVGVDAGLVLDPDRLAAAITPRTRAIVTVSPNNPSGVVQPPEVLARINALCERSGLFHISDEAYAEFVHGDRPHHSPGRAAGSGGHTVSLYSLSKAYGMAGWRIGYAAVPAHLSEALVKVQDTVLICPPRWPQLAARAALEAGPAWCRARVGNLGERLPQLIEAVAAGRDRGLAMDLMARPDGAFYALLEVASPLPGQELVAHLIREWGVAALPGESFGLRPPPGRAVLRLSYGMLEREALDVALDRLLSGLEALSRRSAGGVRGGGGAAAGP
jgi:aspartate/methionine/tyrosine aminotransferase